METLATMLSLESTFIRLLSFVKNEKDSPDFLVKMAELLDTTTPKTEDASNLAFFIQFMSGIRQYDLINYLFVIQKPCLMLLLDGSTIAIALKVTDTIKITKINDQFKCEFIGDDASAEDAPYYPAANFYRGGHQRGGHQRGGHRGSSNKPVMNIDDCQKLLEKMDKPSP